ncbi:MAG: hypothetical protein HFACDABA_03035 [Anaerolineales bacterium]|nr:hypothetical protein [Anaerolineales bacterium]
MTLTMIIVAAIAALAVIALLIPVLQRSNKMDLTRRSDTQPDWMRDMPPAETVARTLADGEGITVFDHEHGERIASPFAEQLEDIVRAQMQADPELAEMKIDFGTGKDQTLEIWVNEKRYHSIGALPDERLKKIVRAAVKRFRP